MRGFARLQSVVYGWLLQVGGPLSSMDACGCCGLLRLQIRVVGDPVFNFIRTHMYSVGGSFSPSQSPRRVAVAVVGRRRLGGSLSASTSVVTTANATAKPPPHIRRKQTNTGSPPHPSLAVMRRDIRSLARPSPQKPTPHRSATATATPPAHISPPPPP